MAGSKKSNTREELSFIDYGIRWDYGNCGLTVFVEADFHEIVSA